MKNENITRSFFSSTQDDVILLGSKIDLAKWAVIAQCKELLEKDVRDPRISSFIEPEVIESWVRSKNYRIDPQMQFITSSLKPQEIKDLIKDKKVFIETAQFYIQAFRPMLSISSCLIVLSDENGVSLASMKYGKRDYKPIMMNCQVGSIWTEETVGTTSLSLCIKLRKTVQLAGPRHYCRAFENDLATVAPIFNSDGNLLGTVLLVQTVSQKDDYRESQRKILQWISSLRSTIENQLLLLERNYRLDSMNRSLQAALSGIGNGSQTQRDTVTENNKQGNAPETVYTFVHILGESTVIKKAIRVAEQFSRIDSGILITGESGTGKEVFAQAIHNSSRRYAPFVAVNCAAIPVNLIGSELFGYVGGAFTGANPKGQIGKIELANGGTLFLDEIGDMPLEIQPALLRVLEDKKVVRLGGNKYIPNKFRLIAATNQDLSQLVKEKKFREDLYYRLAVLHLDIPPLRERGRDILVLAKKFMENIAREAGCAIPDMSKEAEVLIMNYPWPGNVRQLKNTMIYAVNMCQDHIIRLENLPASISPSLSRDSGSGSNRSLFESILSLKNLEKEAIQKALKMTENNVRMAAKILDISKTSLYRKIKEYNLETN